MFGKRLEGHTRSFAPGSRRAVFRRWAPGVLWGIALASWIAATPRNASADLLKEIGAFLGRPLGGFVEAATTPTIQSTESSVHRVVADVDARVGGRLAQIGGMAGGLERTVNRDVQDRLTQADGIMAARIAQVDAAADARLSQALGGVQVIEREAIAGAQLVVKQLDKSAEARIEQINQVATARIGQIDGVVHDAISQADQDARARIEQLDDVAAVRLGSVDLIATKLSLNLQITLLKVGALLGMVAFIVYAFRYLFEHVPSSLRDWAAKRPEWSATKRGAVVTATSFGWFVGHVLVGAVVVGIFGLLSHRLPIGAKTQIDDLTKFQRQALKNGYATLDFDRVRYCAAQLAILDPEHELQHRSLQVEAELVRTAFMRPGLLTSPEGIRQLTDQIGLAERAHEAAEAELDAQGSDADRAARLQADDKLRALDRSAKGDKALTRQSPDALVVTCYAKWQLAQNRADELAAVTYCARALAIDGALASIREARAAAGNAEPFLLAPVATHYLGLYLARPPVSYPEAAPFSLETLGELVKGASIAEAFPPFVPAMKYDELVLGLERDSSTAFVALLDAHAELAVALAALPKNVKPPKLGDSGKKASEAQRAVLAAETRQQAAAQELVRIWQRFDAALDSAPELIGTPLTLSALALNDAPLSHALWFIAHPDAAGLPPRVREEPDIAVRIGMAPIRIAWVRRYLKILSPEVQQLVAQQESARFERDEDETLEFERAYVAYVTASKANAESASPGLRDAAAVAAGKLALYSRQGEEPNPRPLGLALLARGAAATAATREALDAAYSATRLRLL